MLAHGFTHELIAGLVLAGLATVDTEAARIGEQTIEVELVMITAAGRRAIEAEQTSRGKPSEGDGLHLAKLRSAGRSVILAYKYGAGAEPVQGFPAGLRLPRRSALAGPST
jgi:hypothetical protein